MGPWRSALKILKIDHMGIAVPDLAAARAAYEALGFQVSEEHSVEAERVRTAFLPVGESHLELLEPTDADSVIARFLENRKGLHHICVEVEDLAEALEELKRRGVALVDETPRIGAGGHQVAFVHPRAAAGVLLELKQLASRESALRDEVNE